jgi:hypothetical protein
LEADLSVAQAIEEIKAPVVAGTLVDRLRVQQNIGNPAIARG